MTRLARWVLAHKRVVALFWVAVTVAGFATVGHTTKSLRQKFTVPGKEGWVTNLQIARLYHLTGGNGAPLVPTVTLPRGTGVDTPGVRQALLEIERRSAAALPGARVASF